MYQIVVLGLAGSLLFGGAYYIKNADSEGILSTAFSSQASVQVFSEDTIIGTYTCDGKKGCDTVRTLTLSDQGESTLTSGEDPESIIEQGTWQLEKGQLITVSLTTVGGIVYDVPHRFLIQSISTSTLSKISYDVKVFTGMHKPTFQR